MKYIPRTGFYKNADRRTNDIMYFNKKLHRLERRVIEEAARFDKLYSGSGVWDADIERIIRAVQALNKFNAKEK